MTNQIQELKGDQIPESLRHCGLEVLFQLGPVPTDGPNLSIVGSRRMSSDSAMWMKMHLGQTLQELPLQTCSGGAPGVDDLVHTLSLRSQRSTVVFMPCGFEVESYWSKWEHLARTYQLTAYSQFPPGCPVLRQNFHQRNRLIASYSKATLVVQSALKSGSIMTANLAVDFGRRVGIVPSHPNQELFRGNLKLAQEGAELVVSSCDIKSLIMDL